MLPARAFDLAPVRVRIDGNELTQKSSALFDGREVYLSIPIVERMAGWASISPRGDTVLLNVGERRIEIALARPGAEPMVPASLVARALKYSLKNSQGYCDLFSPGYMPKPDRQPERVVVPGVTAPDPPKVDPAKASLPGTHPNVDEKTVGNAASSSGKTSLVLSNEVEPGDKRPASTRVARNDSTTKPVQAPTNGAKLQLASRPDDTGKGTDAGTSKPAVSGQGTSPVQRPDDMDAATVKGTPKAPPQVTRKAPPEEHQITVELARAEVIVPPAPARARVTDVKFIGMDSTHAQVRIATTSTVKAEARLDLEHSQLAIDLPGTTLDPILSTISTEHPFVSGVSAVPSKTATGSQVLLDLKKLVSYQVLTVSPTEVILNLGLPRGAGRKIQDVTIIIDPGHGGDALGCSWKIGNGCVFEKDLTLAIARKVRDNLMDMGCRVIMTRDSDANPSLKERPGMVAQHNADLFVSIHINDCKYSNTATGSESFYHADDSSSRAIAQSVLARMIQVSGLPSRGVKSDLTRFKGTGMAVLRYSPVPSTLVEVGFINHSRDRAKMMTASFQKDIGAAIAAGVRGYVEAKLPPPSAISIDGEAQDIHVD